VQVARQVSLGAQVWPLNAEAFLPAVFCLSTSGGMTFEYSVIRFPSASRLDDSEHVYGGCRVGHRGALLTPPAVFRLHLQTVGSGARADPVASAPGFLAGWVHPRRSLKAWGTVRPCSCLP
jgi:hypothetical protein